MRLKLKTKEKNTYTQRKPWFSDNAPLLRLFDYDAKQDNMSKMQDKE